MFIGITGAKGSGKDTLGDYFRSQGFALVKNADGLKAMLAALYARAGFDAVTIDRMIEGDLKETPCDALLGHTPRYTMQTLGTEWRDMIGKTLWSNMMRKEAVGLMADGAPVVCTDIRFQHEADVVRELGGYLIRVERPGTESGDPHPSEIEMKSLEVDFTIQNIFSIYYLREEGKDILERITGQGVWV